MFTDGKGWLENESQNKGESGILTPPLLNKENNMNQFKGKMAFSGVL